MLVRASTVLDCFSRECPYLSINEISSITNLNKGTIYRILVTLRKIGWVNQDPDSKKYYLGFGLFRLGSLVRNNLHIANVGRSILENIQEQCDETVLLYSKYGNQMITLDCIPGSQFVRAAGDIGGLIPFTPTVVSMSLLAYMSKEEIYNVLPDLTPSRYDQLRRNIEFVHNHGYFIAPGERYSDALGISAPVFDGASKCVAEICLYGPIQRVNAKRDMCITAVLEGAKRLSIRLSLNMK